MVRASTDLMDGALRLGTVATHGDPLGNADNTVAGLDVQYRNQDLAGGTFTADAVGIRSVDDGGRRELFWQPNEISLRKMEW